MQSKWLFILVNVLLCTASDAQLKINIETVYGDLPLQLHKMKYVNPQGDSLSVDVFKFYLSNFSIKTGDTWHLFKDTYFLIDAEEERSKYIILQSNETKIDSLRFIIGIDSIKNVSGALDGALDPALGMFWAWNTGYIFAKLEGTSGSCNTLHNAFEFHIGGYLPPYKAERRVSLKTQHSSGALTIKADARAWFGGTTLIKLSELNSVVHPSRQAQIIADNYKEMFSVK